MSDRMVFSLIFSVLGVIIAVAIVAIVIDSRQWERFMAEHACVVVDEVSASVGVGSTVSVGPSGAVVPGIAVVTIPGKTGYRCDDGKTYWR